MDCKDVEILAQELREPVVGAEDEDRLVVGPERDGDLDQKGTPLARR